MKSMLSKLISKAFNANNIINMEEKSFDMCNTPGVSSGSFVNYLFSNGNNDLAFYSMLTYYELCGPFADAVDKIAQEISAIPIRLWDKEKEEYITDHPILDLLRNPNSEMTESEFMFRLSAIWLITGNIFPYVTGDVEREPLELSVYSPHQINLIPNNQCYIGQINLNTSNNSIVFKQDEDKQRFRYYNPSLTAEIFPIRRFNPRRDGNHLYGLSKANSIFYEIEQYISSSQHNLSLLKNGARPGGAFTTNNETPLTDEQFLRLDEQITKYYQGSLNAGRPLLLENATYHETIQSNRDMDYSTMRKNILEMIYLRYDIPLSLISTSSMTYDNYTLGRLALFDSSVLPVMSYLLEQLTTFLMPRYEDDYENFELKYEQSDIHALELRRNQTIKLRKDIGVNTINELRKFLGDEELEGGDVLYGPSNELPIAMDIYTDDQPKKTNVDSNEKETKEFIEFKNLLASQRKGNGKARYTIEQIIEKANYYGIQQFESSEK